MMEHTHLIFLIFQPYLVCLYQEVMKHRHCVTYNHDSTFPLASSAHRTIISRVPMEGYLALYSSYCTSMMCSLG